MSNVSVSNQLHGALSTNQWVRNGKYPDSYFQSRLVRAGNEILRMRTKVAATFYAPLPSIPAAGGAGTRSRWRFAWHSSTHARYVFVEFMMGRSRNNTDSRATCLIEDSIGTDIGTAEYHYGDSGEVPSDVPGEFGHGIVPVMSSGVIVEITADTDYFGLISDEDNARIVAATVYEVALETTTANGFIDSGFHHGSPVLDTDRQTLTGNMRAAWKRNASGLFSWSVDLQASPRTRTAIAFANIIDTSVTTVTAASPGWTIDLSNRSTVRRTTVPCKLWVYASQSAGAGFINMYASDGSAVVEEMTINSATPQWWSTTVNLPAAADKYDLQFSSDSATNTISLYAASLISYET